MSFYSGEVISMATLLMDTAVLDLHPDAAHPITHALQGVHRALDGLSVDDTAPVSGEFSRLVTDTERAIQRLQALKLRLLSAADAAEVSRDAGLVDTTAWLAKTTRTGGAAASRDVALARDLDELPATAAVFSSGGVSMEHAKVIAHIQDRLPASLTQDQRAAVEQKLLGWAVEVDPVVLRRRARQVLTDVTSREEAERHHASELLHEERAALAKTRLTLHDNHDGTTTGHFTVPALAGDILKKVLQQMTAPRRAKAGAGTAQGGSLEETRDPAHRRG